VIVLPADAAAAHWELRRNCSLPPWRLALLCALPCLLSLLVALALWTLGYPLILAFAGLETLAVLAAFVVYARRATDHASLTLADGALEVQECCGRAQRTTRLATAWLRVETNAAGLRISGRGGSVQLAGYATHEECERIERDLRRALRQQSPG
jgi:uncharacterized membrane protein